MAEARRRDLDQEFAPAGRGEVELDDFERLRLGVGRREAGLAKNGGLDAHGIRVSNGKTSDAGRDRRAGQSEN